MTTDQLQEFHDWLDARIDGYTTELAAITNDERSGALWARRPYRLVLARRAEAAAILLELRELWPTLKEAA